MPGDLDFLDNSFGGSEGGEGGNEGGSPAPSPEPSPPAPAPSPTPSPAPAPHDAYPKTWKQDYVAHWANLPPEVRAEVYRREEDFHKGLAPYRTLGTNLQRALQPLGELIQSQRLNPFELISNFGQMHLALSNPETRLETFKALLQDYGLKIEDLTAEAPYVHPQVAALQHEIGGIKSTLSARERADAEALQARNRAQLEAFAADPEHPHFEKVGLQMASLIKATPGLTLKDAYDQACWLNPEVRAIRVREQAEAEAKKAADAAAAARGSTRNGARNSPETGATGSMDDTMTETLRAIRSRGT